MKFKIKQVAKKIKGGYIGMNYYAAKSHHIPYKHKKKEILVYSHLGKKTKLDTIHHEEIESYLMKNKHMRYHKAHKIALRNEKKPLKQFLKNYKEE